MLVIAVDGAALLRREVHRREAVDPVAYLAVVAAVGALDHEVRRDDAALPRAGNGVDNARPPGAVRA